MQCHAATRHAFMLACREEIERNGAMRDHEVLSRVKLDPPVMGTAQKTRRKQIRLLLKENASAYGLSFLIEGKRTYTLDPCAVSGRATDDCGLGEQETSSGKLSVRARGRGDLGKIDVDVLLDMLGGVEDVEQLDAGAFEKPAAPEASARPLPTLLRLDADFCLELARELLRSEL